MLNRKSLYAILAAAGALALLFVGVGGAPVVSAQEVTPESEEAPTSRIWGWGRGLFGLGCGDQWSMFDTAADVLGLTPEELFTKMRAGNTLEEVAEEQGVDLDALEQAMNASRDEAMRDAIEQAVQDGKMSREQADWLLEGLDKGYMPPRGFGHDGRGPGMRGGFHRFGPGGAAWQSESSDTRAPAWRGSSSL